MRKALCLVPLLALIVAMAVAAPDFSGSWSLDQSKSDPIAMGGGRGGGVAAQPANIDVKMTISQTANELAVVRVMGERTTEMKYALDGKESKNSSGRGEVASVCKWEGDTLVIDNKQTFTMQDGTTRETASKEVYSLSADGKVLTITTTRTTQQGERTTKQVYNKQ